MANSVWNCREETGRGNNWKNEEVIYLLNTIKKNNLMKGSPSGKQLGQLIEPLMAFSRTAFQITGKLKNLRMSYLSCKRRESTQAARRKCPYYDLLSEIYNSDKVVPIDATEMLRQRDAVENEMTLYIAEKLNLPPGSKLGKISHNLLLETCRSQINNGLESLANTEKNILKDHMKSFIESKECESMDKDEVFQELARISKLMSNPKCYKWDCSSRTETDVEQKIIERRAFREAENVSKISKQAKSIDRFFQAEQAASGKSDNNSKDVSPSIDNEGSIEEERECSIKESADGRAKHSRSRAWSNAETLLMLSLLQDFNLTHHIAHRLSLEVVQVIVEPLRERGYPRSPMQIQIKLRNLRKSYYKCLRAGCTQIAIARCPYFYKLNEIYEKFHDTTPPGGGVFQSIKPDDRDLSGSFSGHSYSNSVLEESNASLAMLRGSSYVDSESSQMWMPVETICGEDSTVALDNPKQPGPALDSANESSFEKTLRIGNYDITEEAHESNDMEDSHEESIYERVGKDTPEIPSRIEEVEKPKTIRSQKALDRANSSKIRLTKHKLRKNTGNPYSPKTKKDSSTLRTVRIVMAQLLRHEKLLQRQHHSWMERQFEIQRKHDRDHRELLIKELREFRKSFNSAVPKPPTASNQQVD